MGSGLKCGVNLWVACRDIWEVHDSWKHVALEKGIHPDLPQISWMRHTLKLVLVVLLLFLLITWVMTLEHPVVSSVLKGGLTDQLEL